MGTKEATRSHQSTPALHTTITITETQLQALIDQGVAAAMAEAEASRVRNAITAMVQDQGHTTVRECSLFRIPNANIWTVKGTRRRRRTHSWFEKNESVLALAIHRHLVKSNCDCILQDNALT
ncbi:hypothetical protein Tco_1128766 [Tanacetum coccineum]